MRFIYVSHGFKREKNIALTSSEHLILNINILLLY